MPHILSILASPRLSGLTSRLLTAAEDAARREGCSIERVNVAHLNVAPCMACMRCRAEQACSLPTDDAHGFAGSLAKADGLLIATPTYWGGMTGVLKILFDRTVYALIDSSSPDATIPRPLHKGKPAAMIITSTAPWPANIMTRYTDTAGDLRRILRPSGFKCLKPLHIGGTRRFALPDVKLLARAEATGKAIAIATLRRSHK